MVFFIDMGIFLGQRCEHIHFNIYQMECLDTLQKKVTSTRVCGGIWKMTKAMLFCIDVWDLDRPLFRNFLAVIPSFFKNSSEFHSCSGKYKKRYPTMHLSCWNINLTHKKDSILPSANGCNSSPLQPVKWEIYKSLDGAITLFWRNMEFFLISNYRP